MPGTCPPRMVAVIGAGARGRAFAFRCVRAGYDVVLEDVLSSNLRKAQEEFAAKAGTTEGKFRLAGSVEDAVREADLAIDFVPDELESKLEIFSMMDRMAPPRTIFCTPTTWSIADLASCTYRPERCLGLAPLGQELETTVHLVRGPSTTDDTVTCVEGFFARLGAAAEVTFDTSEPSLMPR